MWFWWLLGCLVLKGLLEFRFEKNIVWDYGLCMNKCKWIYEILDVLIVEKEIKILLISLVVYIIEFYLGLNFIVV